MEGVILWCLVLLITSLVVYFLFFKAGRAGIVEKSLPGPPLIEGIRILIKGVLNNTLHLYLPEWAEKYGDILLINFVVKKVVVINNSDMFRRFVKDINLRDFTNDRPPTFYGKHIGNGNKNIIFAPDGPILRQKRKIFHNILKFYGENRDEMEEVMVSSLTELTKTVQKMDNIDLSAFIKNYILSLIDFLILGKVSEAAHENVKILEELSDCQNKLIPFEIDTALHTFPFLRFLPGLRFKRLYDAICTAEKKFHRTYFDAIKKTFDPKAKHGMIEELLSLQMEEENKTLLDDDTIKAMMQDIVGAGYATSTSILASLLLHLIRYQDIQDRVYQEIKGVIDVATPSSKHRQDMPYTEAIILETLRISSNLPLLVPHFVRKSVIFDGYFIPKSTTVIMNAWYNHHRQDFWEDPWTFRPDRFLDTNGQLLESDHPIRQKLIAFGTGRRECPGEYFAKYRIFLVTTILLQRFQFLPDDNEPLPSLNPSDWGGLMVLVPERYKCKIKLRD